MHASDGHYDELLSTMFVQPNSSMSVALPQRLHGTIAHAHCWQIACISTKQAVVLCHGLQFQLQYMQFQNQRMNIFQMFDFFTVCLLTSTEKLLRLIDFLSPFSGRIAF